MENLPSLIQLYTDDAHTQKAYPIVNEHCMRDGDGNDVITTIKEDIGNLEELEFDADNVVDAINKAYNHGGGSDYDEPLTDYVTPEQFGAVGDGVTDDTDAVQNALNNGLYVYCKNTYLINPIEIESKTTLYGGNFIASGSSADNVGLISVKHSDVIIDNITVDCMNLMNGISCSNYDNLLVNNCKVKNAKGTNLSFGIYLNRSDDSRVIGCEVFNVSNDNSNITRGVFVNKSKKNIVNRCTIHNITSGDDADGVQIIFDNSDDVDYDRTVLSNCEFWDCQKRYIKIQQKNTLIKNCTSIKSKNTFFPSQACISLYCSDITVEDCYIDSDADMIINIIGEFGDNTEDVDNIRIVNNTFITNNTTGSQGVITTSENTTRKLSNVFVLNNILVGNKNSMYGIYLKHSTETNNVFIRDNSIIAYHGVFISWSNDDKAAYKNIVITGNDFDVLYNGVFARGNNFYGLTITKNYFRPYNAYQGYFRVYRSETARFAEPLSCSIKDNYFPLAQTDPSRDKYYKRFINYILEQGDTENMPVYVIRYAPIFEGSKYLNTDVMRELTWYGGENGHWYNPDGTIFTVTS